MNKAKIATVWLDGCSGCHMSILDMDETLLEVVKRADIVYGPLVDAQEFPDGVDVTLVEGAVSSMDDLKLVQKIRKRTRLLVALGDCAVTGNVPSMRNQVPVQALLQRGYIDGPDVNHKVPTDGVPQLLRHAIPVHEVVRVDLHVPGCPPKSDAIAYVVMEVLSGRKPELTGKVKFG